MYKIDVAAMFKLVRISCLNNGNIYAVNYMTYYKSVKLCRERSGNFSVIVVLQTMESVIPRLFNYCLKRVLIGCLNGSSIWLVLSGSRFDLFIKIVKQCKQRYMMLNYKMKRMSCFVHHIYYCFRRKVKMFSLVK